MQYTLIIIGYRTILEIEPHENTHTHTHTHTHTQYYAKASEAESWMSDKKPLVAHGEYGKDEDNTQVRKGQRLGE